MKSTVKMKKHEFRLTDRQLNYIDEMSTKYGIGKNESLRRIIDEHIDRGGDKREPGDDKKVIFGEK